MQGSTPLVVAFIGIGAVGITRISGARVEVRVGRSRRGLGEQGAEDIGISRVGSVLEGTLYKIEFVGKEREPVSER